MSEKIKTFLSSIGVGEETQNQLFAEETPEDWKVEDAASGYVQKRRDLTLNDSETLAELKQKYNREQYPAIVKPLIKRLQNLGGLTSEDLASITKDGQSLPDVKALFDLAETKFKKTSAGTADEIQSQLMALQSEFNTTRETHTAELESVKTDYANQIRIGKVKRHFGKIVAGLDLILPTEAAETLLQTTLLNAYQFNVDDKGLSVLNPDGTKASDGKNFLSAADIIKRQADTFGILKKSNGGSTTTTTTTQQTQQPTTKRNGAMTATEAMKARIEAANKQ